MPCTVTCSGIFIAMPVAVKGESSLTLGCHFWLLILVLLKELLLRFSKAPDAAEYMVPTAHTSNSVTPGNGTKGHTGATRGG